MYTLKECFYRALLLRCLVPMLLYCLQMFRVLACRVLLCLCLCFPPHFPYCVFWFWHSDVFNFFLVCICVVCVCGVGGMCDVCGVDVCM